MTLNYRIHTYPHRPISVSIRNISLLLIKEIFHADTKSDTVEGKRGGTGEEWGGFWGGR